ncbi:hypothetical protein BDF20DRAFT_850732 [Mycotypha africana]|uniref:uncharacterized protein n=1 Tax=Mycotypha africana TaxID=64632 RepID=UPI002301D32B|nr:uncharacterized protein BDF20DRAFT_850732 [Mycotypha africana]KAI8987526.1 hypothetical protein BDF20DRAFT_850732 [Mycotypha africana]
MDTAACLFYPNIVSAEAASSNSMEISPSQSLSQSTSLPQQMRKLQTIDLNTGPTANAESTTTTFNSSLEDVSRLQQDFESLLLSPLTPPMSDGNNDNGGGNTIQAQEVPDDMLVALIDRPAEMRQLVQHNASFFEQLHQELHSNNNNGSSSCTWPRFENTLYCDRNILSDMEWMTRISKALSNGPPHYLSHFKMLVGYIGDESKLQDNMMGKEFLNVPLVRLRYLSELTKKISERSYPQFFINCREALQNDGTATYKLFIDLLFHTDPEELPDHEWEKKIYNILQSHPNVLEQLQEIAAYELEEEEEDDDDHNEQ